MSDTSQGPDWWQASDSKWYPPQAAPQQTAPMVAAPVPPPGPIARAGHVARKVGLTTWEGIWYVIQNIAFGAGYFAKVPAKKALQDFGLVEMTGAEHFWYILMCIGFGAGYFAKIPIAKALSELPQYQAHRQGGLGAIEPMPDPMLPAG
jgi:hypothetical protein